MPLAADLTLQTDAQPVEFLHDRQLKFLDYSNLQPYQVTNKILTNTELFSWRLADQEQLILILLKSTFSARHTVAMRRVCRSIFNISFLHLWGIQT